jgi:hypothetical protein
MRRVTLFCRATSQRVLLEGIFGMAPVEPVMHEGCAFKAVVWNDIDLWLAQDTSFQNYQEMLTYIVAASAGLPGQIGIVDSQLDYARFTRHGIDILPSYFIIHNGADFEELLHHQFSDAERSLISQRILPTVHRHTINIAQLFAQFLGQPPAEDRRKKRIKKEWHEKLGEPTPLKEEDDDNEHVKACIACAENIAAVAFYPCAHQVYCETCLRRVWEDDTVRHECPLCRDPVDDIIIPKQ